MRKCPTHRICLKQTLAAVLPATAPVGVQPQGSVKNPFRKETWNLTEQMKLQKSDPAAGGAIESGGVRVKTKD